MCEHVPSLIETSLSVIALASASSSASFAISSFNFLFIYDKCIIKSKLLIRTDVAAKALWIKINQGHFYIDIQKKYVLKFKRHVQTETFKFNITCKFTIFREQATSALAGCHAGTLS